MTNQAQNTAEQYNKIASSYREISNGQTLREIEWSSLGELLGDIHGLSVLDLACGEGSSCRVLKRWGAGRVVGIDISEEMLNVARENERETHLGIEYLHGDAAEMGKIGDFDLVNACFFLHYAVSKEHLFRMVEVAYNNLRAGQRFVASNANPGYPANPFQDHSKYGLTSRLIDGPVRDGATLHITLSIAQKSVEFDIRYWSQETYDEAFRRAGFKNWQFLPYRVSPELQTKYGAGFWDDYVSEPLVCHVVCQK